METSLLKCLCGITQVAVTQESRLRAQVSMKKGAPASGNMLKLETCVALALFDIEPSVEDDWKKRFKQMIIKKKLLVNFNFGKWFS